MVTYDAIKQIGYNLVNSELTTITAARLFEILRKATNVQANKTIRHYAKILKQEGFITFTSEGCWRINKELKQKKEPTQKLID